MVNWIKEFLKKVLPEEIVERIKEEKKLVTASLWFILIFFLCVVVLIFQQSLNAVESMEQWWQNAIIFM